jgi:hypothetical protein
MTFLELNFYWGCSSNGYWLFETTNIFGNTKYLNLNLVSYWSRIKSSLPMMIFNMKLKTSLPVIWLKYWLKNPGRSVRNEHYKLILILVDPVDDEEIRPRTDLSSVSELGTGLGSSSSNVKRSLRPVLFSAWSIDQDSLWFGSGFLYPVSYRVLSLVSRL